MKLLRLVTVGLVLGAFGSGALADAGAKALFEDSSGTVQAVPTAPTSVATTKVGAAQKKQQVVSAQKFVGLKYWVELVKPDGQTEEKVVSYDFKSGDSIRIQIQSNTNGYIYAVNEGTSGRTNVLFPSRNNPSAYVKAGAVMTVPARGYFTFDDNPGAEKIRLVLSSTPITNNEPAQPSNAQPRPLQVAALSCSTGGSKDLFEEPDAVMGCIDSKAKSGAKDLFAEEDSAPATVKPASYAVVNQNKFSKEGALVAIEFTLKHSAGYSR